MEMLKKYDMNRFCNVDENILDKRMICYLEEKMFYKFKTDWCTRISSYGQGNKLRTYKLFKVNYFTEQYLLQNISIRYRSAYAKFRCGVAPLKIETGRYERLEVNERLCFNCDNSVEDEKHVLLNCPLYEDLRQSLFNVLIGQNNDFLSLSDDKFIFLFSNENVFNSVAKTCHNILQRRNSVLYR